VTGTRAMPSRITLLMTAALVACAPGVRSILFDAAHPLPPRPPGAPVRMFSTERPQCPFDEIGTVSAEGGSLLSSEKIVQGLQDRARAMGGDAIIGVTQGSRSQTSTYAPGRVTTGSMTTLTGTVIRFTDPSCTR